VSTCFKASASPNDSIRVWLPILNPGCGNTTRCRSSFRATPSTLEQNSRASAQRQHLRRSSGAVESGAQDAGQTGPDTGPLRCLQLRLPAIPPRQRPPPEGGVSRPPPQDEQGRVHQFAGHDLRAKLAGKDFPPARTRPAGRQSRSKWPAQGWVLPVRNEYAPGYNRGCSQTAGLSSDTARPRQASRVTPPR
jgi:hypothetical protein